MTEILVDLVVFDLDGTLCHTPAGVDMESCEALLAACTPRPRVLERVQGLHAGGVRLAVLTQRGPQVAAASRQQLATWLPGVPLDVHHRPRLVWDYADWIPDKEAALRRMRRSLSVERGRSVTVAFVADLPEDRAAALRAGVGFLWDWEFEARGLAQLSVPVLEA